MFQQQGSGVNIGGNISEVYQNISEGRDVVEKAVETTPAPPAVDHAAAPLHGLGLWIRKVEDCEGGDPLRIVERAVAAGLRHVAIRPTGAEPKSLETQTQLVTLLRDRGVQVWGWKALGGIAYAADLVAINNWLKKLPPLAGYIVQVGAEFKQADQARGLESFFGELRGLLGVRPIGLSSFHYPTFYRDMPWNTLLTGVDFVMPQVFWEQAHNPGAQLKRSLEEYAALSPARPVFPLGAAYGVGEWQPTFSDLMEFIDAARSLGLNGASLFNWDWLGRLENRDRWAVLEKMRWEAPLDQTGPPRAVETEEVVTVTVPPPEPPPAPDRPILQPAFARQFVQMVHNDEVAKVEDQLGFENYAEAFVQLVQDARTQPPLTVGISGAWGSGKSFLLRRIRERLEALPPEPAPRRWYQWHAPRGRRRVRVVNFNAWDYNACEAVWPGLVRSILDRLEGDASFWARSLSRVRRNFQRQFGSVRGKVLPWAIVLVAALAVVVYLAWGNWWVMGVAAGAVGLSGAWTIFKTLVDLPVAQWLTTLFETGRGYGGALGYMDEIRADIQELQQQLGGTKVVVIIDDLDRCNADKIVETLEAIKLLLNFDFFMIFLAVDASVIARAIENQKDMLVQAGRSGYLYLDKIIQIPFRIPEPDPVVVNKYLFGLLAAADTVTDRPLPKAKADLLRGMLRVYEPSIRPPALEAVLPLLDTVPDSTVDGDVLALELARQLPHLSAAVRENGTPWLVWAILSRWWPVSAYLMHETLRANPAGLYDPAREKPVLRWLATIVEAKAAADISTQKLREAADGPRALFDQAIARAPRVSLFELQAVLADWTKPYALTIGFTSAEREAMQNLSKYLIKNPRHIKRLVNTYSLIRLLAQRAPIGDLILNAPEATLKWLILSSQWPLTAQAMLQAFEDEKEIRRPGELLPGDDDALTRLYAKAQTLIRGTPDLAQAREHLDWDVSVLDNLIRDSSRILTSNQLDLLRAYTINFNPAENEVPHAPVPPLEVKVQS